MTDLAEAVATKWIVVLNYNVAAHCIRQLEALLPLPATGMFIVDNVSADDDFRTLEAACRAHGGCIVEARTLGTAAAQAATLEAVLRGDRLVLFRNAANLGYSGGNNTALRLLHGLLGARGAYLVINPDLVLTHEAAAQLLDATEEIAGPAIFQHYMQTIDTTGHAIDFATGFVSDEMRRSGRIGMLHGCCIKFSGTAFDRYGFLPDENFLYEEELKYFERVHRLGGAPAYLPHIRVEHLGKASVRKVSHEYFYYIFRNKLTYFRDIAGPTYGRHVRFVLLYLDWCRAAIWSQVRKGNWSGATGVLHGVRDGLRGIKGPLPQHRPAPSQRAADAA